MPDAPYSAGTAQRENPLRDIADAALIAAALLILFAVAVATLQASWNRSTIWLPALFGLLSASPFILAAVSIRRHGDAFAAGAASALGWITIVTVFCVTFGGVLSVVMLLLGVRGPLTHVLYTLASISSELKAFMPTTAYVLLAGVAWFCAVLIRNARRARRGRTPAGERKAIKGAALVWAYAVGVIPIFSMLSSWNNQRRVADDARRASMTAKTVVAVRTTLRQMQACLFAYSSEHKGAGYPQGLDAVGPNGSRCFDSTSATVRAVFANARLRYVATTPDSAGRMTEFWILAEPMAREAAWGRQYYADEKGLVYYGDMRPRDDSIAFNRPVPDSPFPPNRELLEVVDSPVSDLTSLQRCLAGRGYNGASVYPHEISESRCLTSRWRNENELTLGVFSRFDERLPGGVYYGEYRPRRPVSESAFGAYSISLQPMTYGEDGTRSYWSDELRRIHWTREDRPANANDPLVDDCELGIGCK